MCAFLQCNQIINIVPDFLTAKCTISAEDLLAAHESSIQVIVTEHVHTNFDTRLDW